MKQKKLWITICVLGIICLSVAAFLLIRETIILAGTDQTIRWTIIGALGSWAGSVFGAIALIISILAFRLPQQVKLSATISCGIMLAQAEEGDRIDAYIITVKNIGMRPVTVTNVYLHFGGKKRGDIYVGILNQGTVFQAFTPSFPKRLEQGESFEYYLLKDKLDVALAHYEEQTPRSTSFSIRIDEVTIGTQYYKTKWTLGSFFGDR